MMASEMSHWERVRAALKGEETDRVPISLWRHWPVEDETPQGLAAATIRWQRDYDFDLVDLTLRHCMAMLERVIEYFLAAGNVCFARLMDVVQEMEERE